MALQNLTGAGRKSGAAGRSSVAGQRTSAASAATHGGGGARTSVRTGSPATGSRGSLTSGGMRTSESLALLFSETMTLLALGADKCAYRKCPHLADCGIGVMHRSD